VLGRTLPIRRYLGSLKQVLDHAGVEPNPARHRTVKLPKITREEPNPPTARHVLTILRRVPARMVLPLNVLEHCGLRVGEAVSLRWATLTRRVTAAAARVGDEVRPGPVGAGATLAHGRDRGDLSARGSCA
jgi:integrase